jgi:hypothetical protein
METSKYHHIGKHFYHRKAILEYYDCNNKRLENKEFDIIPERRFLFHGLDLDKQYVSFWEDYEIIIYEKITIKEVPGGFIYVPENTCEPISQSRIDEGLINKLYGIQINEVPNYLTYQLKKYQNRKNHLKRWKGLIETRPDLAESLYGRYRPDVQKVALEWINSRIRRGNLREYKPSRDVSLDEIFASNENMKQIIQKLEEHGYAEYWSFAGRYQWRKGGQDLAVLGEILQKRKHFKGFIDYHERFSTLTRFFNVRGKSGFGERTFQQSTIEEVIDRKQGQFSFIRYQS